MHFTVAWAEIARKNLGLRTAVFTLTLLCSVLTVSLVAVSMKEPVVVERGCFSTAATKGDTKQNDGEIKAFVKAAIEQRLNSDVIDLQFLSADEQKKKSLEQDALKQKEISQTVLVRSVEVSKQMIRVEADKLISVGKIRSAFPTNMVVRIERTTRTASNPYGLLLLNSFPDPQ